METSIFRGPDSLPVYVPYLSLNQASVLPLFCPAYVIYIASTFPNTYPQIHPTLTKTFIIYGNVVLTSKKRYRHPTSSQCSTTRIFHILQCYQRGAPQLA